MAASEIADLRHLAQPGAVIAVRVTPRSQREAVLLEAGVVRVLTRALPSEGAANAAVAVLLARALGVAKTRLRLTRGQTSRDKVFTLESGV